jgi:hypothetical protein
MSKNKSFANRIANSSSLENLLKNIYNFKDLKIRDLKGEQRISFDSLVNFVKILYGTPYFEKLQEKVNEIFGSIEEIKPGTVSGYVLGAILSRRFYQRYSRSKDDSWICSPYAMNSIPTPDQKECLYFVITIEYDKKTGKYSLIMNKNSNEDRAIIFTTTAFAGLTNEDKMKLKNYGINYVKVFKIGPRDFFDVIPEWTPVEHVEDFSHAKFMALEPRELEFTGNIPKPYHHIGGGISTVLLVILPVIFLILVTLVIIVIFFLVKKEERIKKYQKSEDIYIEE